MARFDISQPPYSATDGGNPTINRQKIQAAFDDARNSGGGEVFFPEGLWKVDDLLLVYSNTILTGEGPGSVVEKTVDNTKVLFHIYGTGNQQSNFIRKTTYVAPTDGQGGIHFNIATGGIITDNLIENFDSGIFLSAVVTTRMVQEFQISRNVLRKCNKGVRVNSAGYNTGLIIADDNRFPGTTIPIDTTQLVVREGYLEGTKVVLFATTSPPPAPTYGTYEVGDRIINQVWESSGKILDKYRKADRQWADRKTV